MSDPTDQLYRAIGDAFDYFNSELFEGALPKVIFTVQRKKGVVGYFAPDRWGSKEGESCHEIAINPAYLAQSRAVEIFQTLVHEMAHCWQFCLGSPGRAGYHNRQWARKMINVGLMPSDTGSPGGAITGQHMSDYIIDDGPFYKACSKLVSDLQYQFNWIDRYALPKLYPDRIFKAENPIKDNNNNMEEATESSTIRKDTCSNTSNLVIPQGSWLDSTFSELLPEGFVQEQVVSRPKRYRYHCPNCDSKVYGRPKLKIKCMDCDEMFEWGHDLK